MTDQRRDCEARVASEHLSCPARLLTEQANASLQSDFTAVTRLYCCPLIYPLPAPN